MSVPFPLTPQPPSWSIDWSAIDVQPWIEHLKGCPQHPIRHAEGDVWNHVHMVCEAMVEMPAWRELAEGERDILFKAALLHDVAKPICTRIDADGSISSRGHSWRGAVLARQILWQAGVGFREREQVTALVRHHLVPFFLAESENPLRHAVEVSQTARCDWLSILAYADARGRRCDDPQRLFDQIDRFRSQCLALGCLENDYRFVNDHARFLYFRDPGSPLDQEVRENYECEVTLMSGLPGAGKDFWIRKQTNAHVLSLDGIRHELGITHADPQGVVLARAKERARDYLRNRQPFIWNAANLSRYVRADCIRLFHEFGARVCIVYVEVTPQQLAMHNRQRRKKVPNQVIDRLLDKWEVPDKTEAHEIQCIL